MITVLMIVLALNGGLYLGTILYTALSSEDTDTTGITRVYGELQA